VSIALVSLTLPFGDTAKINERGRIGKIDVDDFPAIITQ
jgi:hypothetical protein